ncbi:hypothetical protein D3C75_707680 [compost metagenome]
MPGHLLDRMRDRMRQYNTEHGRKCQRQQQSGEKHTVDAANCGIQILHIGSNIYGPYNLVTGKHRLGDYLLTHIIICNNIFLVVADSLQGAAHHRLGVALSHIIILRRHRSGNNLAACIQHLNFGAIDIQIVDHAAQTLHSRFFIRRSGLTAEFVGGQDREHLRTRLQVLGEIIGQ